MWCLYLVLCFPTGEVVILEKMEVFQLFFFVIGLGQQDISITEGVTGLGAVPTMTVLTIHHRYGLMEKRRHIRTCGKAQPPFRNETSHCISQAKVGSIFFHDGLDRSQKHHQNYRGTTCMVTLTLENKSPPKHWRYLISDDTSTKNTMNCSFPNLPRYQPWVLDIPSRQVREGITLQTVLNPVSLLTAMPCAGSSVIRDFWQKKLFQNCFECVWGLK